MLESEHRVIEKVVAAASILVEKMDAGQEMEVKTLHKLVDFMRTYADQCHHGKEENLLFPALAAKGVPTQGCPLGALTAEHNRGRALVKDLFEGITAVEDKDMSALEKVRKALLGITTLYPNHIWKEDFLLFPMTNKVLAAQEQQAFIVSFNQVDDGFGREVLQGFEQFAQEISTITK